MQAASCWPEPCHFPWHSDDMGFATHSASSHGGFGCGHRRPAGAASIRRMPWSPCDALSACLGKVLRTEIKRVRQLEAPQSPWPMKIFTSGFIACDPIGCWSGTKRRWAQGCRNMSQHWKQHQIAAGGCCSWDPRPVCSLLVSRERQMPCPCVKMHYKPLPHDYQM